MFRDFQYIKPAEFQLIHKNNLEEELLYPLHNESYHFFKYLIDTMIQNNCERQDVEDRINELMEFNFIKDAREYFKTVKRTEALEIFCKDIPAHDYYDWFIENIPKLSVKQKAKLKFYNLLGKIKK